VLEYSLGPSNPSKGRMTKAAFATKIRSGYIILRTDDKIYAYSKVTKQFKSAKRLDEIEDRTHAFVTAHTQYESRKDATSPPRKSSNAKRSYVKKHRVGMNNVYFRNDFMTPDTLYRVWFVQDTFARYEKLNRFSDILKHDSEEIKEKHHNERLLEDFKAKQTRQVMTLTQVELIRFEAGYSILLLTIRPEESLECRYAMMKIDELSQTETTIDNCLSKLRFLQVELRIWTRDNKLFRKVLAHKEFNKNHLTVPHIKSGRTDWYKKVRGDRASLPSGGSLRSHYIRKNKDANANSIKAHYISRHIMGEECPDCKGKREDENGDECGTCAGSGIGLPVNDSAFVLWKMVYPINSYDRYTCNDKGQCSDNTCTRPRAEHFGEDPKCTKWIGCKEFEMPIAKGKFCEECNKEGKHPRDTYKRLTDKKLRLTDKIRGRLQPNLEEHLKGVRCVKNGAVSVDRGDNHSGHGHQIPAWEAEKMAQAFFGEKHTTELDNLGLYKIIRMNGLSCPAH